MNGIENITNKIIQDAQAQAAEIIANGEAEAKVIVSQYAQDAEKEKNRLLDNARKSIANREARLGSVAELEGRKDLLNVKQELIGKAFEEALTRLQKLPEKEYLNLLCKLAADASQSKDEEIILSPDDNKKYGQQVVDGANKLLSDKGLTLSPETRAISGGLILKKGNIEINCDLKTQVRMVKESLAMEIANKLFS